jgi:uncharacterized protein with ParB-like and HNH nuclease domain
MTRKISGAEFPLSKIFSSDFEYVIPSYQRPYAWGEEQASELLYDLLEFYKAEEEEGYFLGSIVLIKSENNPFSEVIDGQQRLTTLTILFASMACAHGGVYRKQLQPYIIELGKELEGILPKPRLTLRERDRKFFKKYIQEFNITKLDEINPNDLDNESQENISGNSKFFLREIEALFPESDELRFFIKFLLTRCYLVVVSTPTQASAFRVFSVMNSRGLDLQPTDIIKADLIGKIEDEGDRTTYNRKWEEMEVDLTRSGFNDLFSHIRMIYVKDKAKQTLLEEFRKFVLPQHPDPRVFIDEILEPFVVAMKDIKSEGYEAPKHAEKINNYICWLNRIDNSDWIPPAMLFLKLNRGKPDRLLIFFRLLECLAAYMHICRLNVNRRVELYALLIEDIENKVSPNAMFSLNLDENEKEEFRNALDGNIYELSPRKRNYLMLRLDSFIADGAANYDSNILTIEHVLPQTVEDEGEWAVWFSPDERKEWVHRLANLVPLNKKRNSAAQNYEFQVKCKKYFSGTKNVSSYALTTQVICQKEWTPAIIKKRQGELLEVLIENWQLEAEK